MKMPIFAVIYYLHSDRNVLR